MMLGTSKKQQNLPKNGLEAALGNKTPFRRHFAGQGAAKSSQKDAKLAAKGSQDGAKWHKLEPKVVWKASEMQCVFVCDFRAHLGPSGAQQQSQEGPLPPLFDPFRPSKTNML